MKRKILTIALSFSLVLFFQSRINAQDVHFSQFYMQPLLQNPAMAGAEHDMQAIMNYKNQWQSVSVPFRTYAFSYDMRLGKVQDQSGSFGQRKGFWAIGANFFSDQEGNSTLNTTEGAITVAYHVIVSQYSLLGAGVQGGFGQRNINYAALSWGDQYDGTDINTSLPSGEAAGTTSRSYADLSAGLNWCYDNTSGLINVTDNHDLKADIGLAVYHINQPNYSFYGSGEKLYMKYVFHANGLVCIPNSNIGFAPGLFYYREGTAQEFYLGTLIRYKIRQDSKYTGFYKSAAISLGGYYRAGDAAIAALMIEYSHYAFGISYDVNSSGLTNASSGRGGIEISLRFVSPDPFGGLPSATKARF